MANQAFYIASRLILPPHLSWEMLIRLYNNNCAAAICSEDLPFYINVSPIEA